MRQTLLCLVLPLLAAALPHPQDDSACGNGTPAPSDPAPAVAHPPETNTTETSPPVTNATTPSGSGGTFTLQARRSGSTFHLLPIHAAGQSLVMGVDASTSCPAGNAAFDCGTLASNGTAFAGDANTLYVAVAGGQRLFARADGRLGYTQAHSMAVPDGATTGGGSLTGDAGSRDWTWRGAGDAGGLVACPAASGGAKWTVYAARASGQESCLGFRAVAVPYTGPAAWQYD